MCKFNLTLEFIADSFNKYNKKYFNGSLNTPKFEIIHSKSHLGLFNWRGNNFTIRISNYFDRTQRDYENTIIHEMIHHYIRQNKIKDTSRHHGRVFYEWADKINRDGWNISRTNSVEGCGLTDKSNNIYNVCSFISGKTGKRFMFVMHPNYISYYKNIFKNDADYYRNVDIFISTNDKKFASYPKCRSSIRGWYVSNSDYEKEKSAA